MNEQSAALMKLLEFTNGHAANLLASLRREHDCLKTWDMDGLDSELKLRQELVAGLQVAMDQLVAAADVVPGTGLGKASLHDSIRELVEIASAATTGISETWQQLLDLGESLETQHRINAGMIVLGRQVAEQTISQLVIAANGEPPASLYSPDGTTSQPSKRLLGLA